MNGRGGTNMQQVANVPTELYDLVDKLAYRPGWTVALGDVDRGQGSDGLTLTITTMGYNSYHPEQGQNYGVHHYFPVPPAAYKRADWQRWLLDQFILVESHEACEFFTVDGDHPYAPNHGPGRNPYTIREMGTALDAATSFRGVVNA